MDGPWRDIRWTWRRLARDRWFLVTAVLTLAVGIGLNATVFGLVDRLAFEPLPVDAPAELVSVYGASASGAMTHGPISTRELERIRDEISAFRGTIATTYAPIAVEQAGNRRLVLGERVTVDYFSLLGVEPALGRTFVPGEDEAPIVVLSDSAWRRHHGAAPDILGQTLRVGGEAVTIVGVAPRGFTGLMHGIAPELWRPMRVTASEPAEDRAGAAADRGWLWVTGRLASGRSLVQAESDVGALTARLHQDDPVAYDGYQLTVVARHRVRVLPGLDGALVAVSWIALGGVGLVLLIASANVANLQLARAVGRRREIATRLALGAGPARIVRQLLTESLVLAALGGAVGWLVALGANRLLERVRWPIPVDIVWGQALDLRVVLFTLAVSTVCAVAFGLAPAVDAARTDLTRGLRGLTAGGRGSGRWRRALVAIQIAVSMVLLIGAGLATRSLAHASRIDLGFEPDGVVVASFAPSWTTSRVEDFYRRLLPRVEALPGVDAAGLVSHLPLTLERRFERVDTGSANEEVGAVWPQVESATVGPGAFEALGVERRQGRLFEVGDTTDSAPVAIVNEAFVERFWPFSRTKRLP
ncbi:MAG: ABC transporter permease [Acidobacteriota bacterium]